MNRFCITSENEFKCTSPIFEEFGDEILIIKIILEYFKRYLPEVMSKKVDCYNRQILLDPSDIDVKLQKDPGKYVVILVLTDDESKYPDDGFRLEETTYSFQLNLEVVEDDVEGSLENLIKLKSGVKTLLVNMDRNLGLTTNIEGFTYDGPFTIEGTNDKHVRLGTYRFSVSDTQVRQ